MYNVSTLLEILLRGVYRFWGVCSDSVSTLLEILQKAPCLGRIQTT